MPDYISAPEENGDGPAFVTKTFIEPIKDQGSGSGSVVVHIGGGVAESFLYPEKTKLPLMVLTDTAVEYEGEAE